MKVNLHAYCGCRTGSVVKNALCVTASKGLVDAAHFCYLMAQVGFGVYTKKSTKMVLIGSNHRCVMAHRVIRYAYKNGHKMRNWTYRLFALIPIHSLFLPACRFWSSALQRRFSGQNRMSTLSLLALSLSLCPTSRWAEHIHMQSLD